MATRDGHEVCVGDIVYTRNYVYGHYEIKSHTISKIEGRKLHYSEMDSQGYFGCKDDFCFASEDNAKDFERYPIDEV
jgi:hypothetical protein